MQRDRSIRRRQFVFVAFGRGAVLDHAPRWWERIWLRLSLLLRRGADPQRLDDLIGSTGIQPPDSDDSAGAADRVPRRPPDRPLAGAIALPEPSSPDESARAVDRIAQPEPCSAPETARGWLS